MSEQSNETETPLAEAKSTIAELFVRDPLGLSDEEIDRMTETLIVAKMRWAEEEAEAKAKGRNPLPSKGITLENLDL